jgi:hypothetical protein
MATPFDRLMDTVRSNIPGAVDITIKQELFGVCQDFFRESNVWQENIPFTILPNTDTAEVLPYAGKIERLNWVNNADAIPVRNATMPDPYNGVILMPYAAAGDYFAQLILNVSDPVSRDVFPIVPNSIMERHWEVIMHGLLSRMMAQPKKTYSDINLAALYNSKFKGGTARARNDAKALYRQGAQAWRFPQTFNNHGQVRR